MPPKYDYRDVSLTLQKLREFLLGRKHTLHVRFPPNLAPRTLPTPDIPRGPERKYSNQYYYQRNYKDSVMPPVVAPIGEGPSPRGCPRSKAFPPDAVCFNYAPTPGPTWWWDGHCYYTCVPDSPCCVDPCSPCPPCPPCPCPPEEPPVPRSPDCTGKKK